MSSEEEMHMLPSFCEGVPSDMSPSEWCLVLFPTLPAELSQESGERGSIGEREMLRHFLESGVQMEKGRCCGIFWRMGFTMAIASYRQATGVQIGEWGSLFWQNKMLGFNCSDRGSFAQKKNLGVQEKHEKER